MKLTNDHGLPASVVTALTQSQYSKGAADYSVTQLIGPPMITKLYDAFGKHVEEDVMDRLWAFLGSTAHQILANAADKQNAFTEQRLFMDIGGLTISGASDLLEADDKPTVESLGESGTPDRYTITDYKFTSAFGVKIAGPLKPDFVSQLNSYRLLYNEHNFLAERLRIVYIFRDWKKFEARNSHQYPQTPVLVVDVPVWSLDKTREFLEGRVTLHERARLSLLADVPVCTQEERWFRQGNFGVMKKGNKKSTKNFDTRSGAETFIKTRTDEGHKDALKYSVEERPGVEVRCSGYCRVAGFCRHGRTVHAGLPDEEQIRRPDDAAMAQFTIAADESLKATVKA